MTIAIIEDELLFRDILRKACTVDLGHTVVGEAGSGREALDIVPSSAPDLVILDLNLPDIGGLAVLESLRRTRALLKTLVMSSYCDEYTVYRVEKASVHGFLDKSTNTIGELGQAIRAIESGATYFSNLFTRMRTARARNPLRFDKVLTEREQTILSLIGEPMSDAEIAVNLGVSPETVEKHRFNVMNKLSFSSRSEMARYARRCGLTRPVNHF